MSDSVEEPMRLIERPLIFEETYPKYEFAPLVELGMSIAAWLEKKFRGNLVPCMTEENSLKQSQVEETFP
jgi:hypothetical protein